jgi:hypothetical protein
MNKITIKLTLPSSYLKAYSIPAKTHSALHGVLMMTKLRVELIKSSENFRENKNDVAHSRERRVIG